MSNTVRSILAPVGLRPIHPLHAILLACVAPMSLGAWLSDLAYTSSFHVQWINFAAWLIVGALIGGGFALLWVLVELGRRWKTRSQRLLIYAGLLMITWVLGFINALVHAKDAWATMPAGVWLSFIVTLLALLASWIGFSGLRAGEVQ